MKSRLTTSMQYYREDTRQRHHNNTHKDSTQRVLTNYNAIIPETATIYSHQTKNHPTKTTKEKKNTLNAPLDQYTIMISVLSI